MNPDVQRRVYLSNAYKAWKDAKKLENTLYRAMHSLVPSDKDLMKVIMGSQQMREETVQAVRFVKALRPGYSLSEARSLVALAHQQEEKKEE